MNTPGTKPHVWLTRAGAHGQDEDVALDEQLAVIGFKEVGDLRTFASLEEIVSALMEADPHSNERRAQTQARQLWTFRNGIAQGDIVVLPFKTRKGHVALGTVVGDYDYRNVSGEVRHTRLVNWLRPDVSRTAFGQDLLYCLGAHLTVCRITRHDAEARVLTILNGGGDPGFNEEGRPSNVAAPNSDADSGVMFDIAQTAHDEIAVFVRDRYRGHDLARLVEGVLRADGFQTHRLAPGPDGGADILAGKGPGT